MDGTLTANVIDFAAMRRRAGVHPVHGDILDEVAKMSPERQAKAKAAIKDVELQALEDMRIMPGAAELCGWLDSRGVPRGLLTRNVRASVEHFHANHLVPHAPFSPAIGRECGFAYKPSPEALLHICSVWGIAGEEAVFVGDSAKDDIVCGNRAGAITILLDEEGRYSEQDLQGEAAPHFKISRLSEVRDVLEAHFELQPPRKANVNVASTPGEPADQLASAAKDR